MLFQRGTLASELERRHQYKEHFSEKLLLRIFQQICEGVKCMHEAKPEPLAHRDLKTANVLLAADYTPVIMDLGKFIFVLIIYCRYVFVCGCKINSGKFMLYSMFICFLIFFFFFVTRVDLLRKIACRNQLL